MSKRDLSANLDVLKRHGIFPEALLNFVALLGWSHSRGSDFMTMQQLIEDVSSIRRVEQAQACVLTLSSLI